MVFDLFCRRALYSYKWAITAISRYLPTNNTYLGITSKVESIVISKCLNFSLSKVYYIYADGTVWPPKQSIDKV